MTTKTLKANGLNSPAVADKAGTIYTISGSTKDDKVLISEGAVAKKISLGKGSDQVHLSGDHTDYIFTQKTSKILTLTSIDNLDVYVNVTIDSTKDKIVFGDGYFNVTLKGKSIQVGSDLLIAKGESYTFNEDQDGDAEFSDVDLSGDEIISETAGSGTDKSETIISIDGIGSSQDQGNLDQDLSDNNYTLVDDVTKPNNVIVENFGAGDKIQFTKAPVGKQTTNLDFFSEEGNTTITYALNGKENAITLIGLYDANSDGPSDLATFKALGNGEIVFI